MKSTQRSKLSEGDILDVYTDYQDEDPQTYEGKAVLLKLIRYGDSFYLKNEELRVEDKKVYTPDEQSRIVKYNSLRSYFRDADNPPNKFMRKFYKLLVEQRKDLPDDFERIAKVIEAYKHKPMYRGPIHDMLKKHSIDYICQFINQDRDKWRPTIYNYERWLVQFTEDNWGYPANHTAQRNFRYVSCVMPSEKIRDADIRKYTTYNGASSIVIDQCEDCDDDLEEEEEDLTEYELTFKTEEDEN